MAFVQARPERVASKSTAQAPVRVPAGADCPPRRWPLPQAAGPGAGGVDVVGGRSRCPPFDNSAMDGYAVRARRGGGRAGDAARRVRHPGRAHRRPAAPARRRRADHDRGAGARGRRRDRAGRADRRRHRDRRDQGRARGRRARAAHRRRTSTAGDVVLTAGTVLGPAQIGVAAAVGHARARGAPPSGGARAVHRLRAGRAGHAAAAGPDLRVERADARRGGRGRGRPGGAPALRPRRRRAVPRRARRADGRASISCSPRAG